MTDKVFVHFSHKLADGKTRKLMSRNDFRLLHYAGEVNYNVNGKNGPIISVVIKPHNQTNLI